MALKKTLTDPLNWLLLLLGAAFIYYIFAVPYFTEFYVKTPQQMTMAEYLGNPSHPRPFMLHALSAPPAGIEIEITGLQVAHIDTDSILLVDPTLPGAAPAAAAPAPAPAGDGTATDGTADDGSQAAAEPVVAFMPEAAAPTNQIMIPGDNLDLLAVSVGQTVSVRLHGLYESPLGWVPQDPIIPQDVEDLFDKDELDALDLLKVIAGGNEIPIPYVEVDELRFANDTHLAGERISLADLANDTTYIQTSSRLAGAPVDVFDVTLVEKRFEDRAPYYIFQDSEGRRGRVFYNARLLSEWYWTMDRLSGTTVVVRGSLRPFTPSQLRDLESNDNIQAVLDGLEILSTDGTVVINLENPLGGLGIGG